MFGHRGGARCASESVNLPLQKKKGTIPREKRFSFNHPPGEKRPSANSASAPSKRKKGRAPIVW